MKALVILALALGLQISGRATEDNVRTFLAIDPDALDTKVPHGFGKVFVEAGRQNNIDPSFWPRFPPTNQADGKVAPPG